MTTVCETRSFHTRLRLTPKQDAALRDACRVFGDVTRAVYQELKHGNDDPRTELTAKLNMQRWYIDSAMRRVKGLLQSAKSNRSRYTADYQAKADAYIAGLRKSSTLAASLPHGGANGSRPLCGM